MKLDRTKKLIILMIVVLIFIYGILIPIVPLGKFLFSEAKVVRIYPYNFYLLKSLPNEEKPNFHEYMKKNGWIYIEEMESTWVYKKGNSKKYITYCYNLIDVIIDKSNVRIWHEMCTKLNCSKSTFFIMILCYMLPAFGFVIFMMKLKNLKRT